MDLASKLVLISIAIELIFGILFYKKISAIDHNIAFMDMALAALCNYFDMIASGDSDEETEEG